MASANASSLPIIMLTAHADEKLVIASLKAGANGYLVKPLIPKRLMELIAKLCRSALPTLRCHKHG
ncbi:response regulator [Azospirillum sp.]|uniref:response regulator n=1 Tax=Azospirillum sp. TaxID=34012 RepID=UPI0026316CB5|nr:response regulator [Azospirillum sp.]